jgi:FolB domain-containing protein
VPANRREKRDTVAVRGIRARGFHGVLPEERREGQDFVVDVTMGFDTAPAAATDDLARTVDYSAVAADVVAILTGEPVDLVETLAAMIAAQVLTRELVDHVEVSVHKPEAPVGVPFDDVVVTITRTRDEELTR